MSNFAQKQTQKLIQEPGGKLTRRAPLGPMGSFGFSGLDTDISGLCKAVSDPLRTAIVRTLAKDSFGVQELAKILDMPQPGMSHHLKILATSGLLTARRQGNSIFYRRTMLGAGSPIGVFVDSLFKAIDSTAIPADILSLIEEVHQERSEVSRYFFEKNSARFHEKQGQLCGWSEYASNLLEMLKLIPDAKLKTALEVGPGQGQLLAEISKMFQRVVAIDNSEKMLELARKNLDPDRNNVDFISQPLENVNGAEFDLIILNMVLHHMASPAGAFKKLADIVRGRGFLIVADLNAHDQDWARESCGDVWLGFTPEEMEEWANQAGFKEMNSQYLGLRNGFQIQIKLFQRR